MPEERARRMVGFVTETENSSSANLAPASPVDDGRPASTVRGKVSSPGGLKGAQESVDHVTIVAAIGDAPPP